MDNRLREDYKYVYGLIVQGEHQKLDFKQTISDSKKIARSLVAFVNSDGGTLLVGVKNNGNITGIRSDEELYMLDAAIKLYCHPSVPVKLQLWEPIKNKNVLEVIVYPNKNTIWKALDDDNNWKIWLRYQDMNILADGVWEKLWYRNNKKKYKPIVFTKYQLSLLGIIPEHKSYSLNELAQYTDMQISELEELVADFVYMGLLSIQLTKSGIVYSVKK